MSLINQMLKDLEARNQRDSHDPRRAVQVVVSQTPQINRLRLIIAGLVVLIVFAILGGWWWLSHQNSVAVQVPLQQVHGPQSLVVGAVEVQPETPLALTVVTAVPEKAELSPVAPQEVEEPGLSAEALEIPAQAVADLNIAVENSLGEDAEELGAKEPVVGAENRPLAAVATLVVEPQSALQRAQQLRIEGRALVQQQRYLDGAKRLNQALQIDHASAKPWQELVRVYVQAGDLSRAMDAATRGAELYPDDVDLRVYRARLIVEAGDYASALATLKTGELPSVVSSSDYYALLASVLQQMGQFDEASEQYALLTTIYPHRGDWWIGRAICADQLGAAQQAMAYYQQALACQQLSSQLKQFALQQLTRLRKG